MCYLCAKCIYIFSYFFFSSCEAVATVYIRNYIWTFFFSSFKLIWIETRSGSGFSGTVQFCVHVACVTNQWVFFSFSLWCFIFIRLFYFIFFSIRIETGLTLDFILQAKERKKKYARTNSLLSHPFLSVTLSQFRCILSLGLKY